MESSTIGRAVAGGAPVTATLATALNTITDLGERANGLAEQAERLAAQIAGSAPSQDSGAKARRDADNITDALNERASAIRDPLYRLQMALDRISQRID